MQGGVVIPTIFSIFPFSDGNSNIFEIDFGKVKNHSDQLSPASQVEVSQSVLDFLVGHFDIYATITI